MGFLDIQLKGYQMDAVKRLSNGKILRGDTGVGKSRTALAYYFFRVAKGRVKVNGTGEVREMKTPVDLFIITTASKRNKHEWDDELEPFGLKVGENDQVHVIVDSWQNVKKYVDVQNAFFLFDEQKVTGKGVWVKSFYKIAKHNKWILATATPGDVWMDYIPVFVANGFYKNRTEFEREHVVYKRFSKFPQVDKILYEDVLNLYLKQILVNMEKPEDEIPDIVREHEKVICNYDKSAYKQIMATRTDPETGEPFMNASALCYALRRVCNKDTDRYVHVLDIVKMHGKAIIFYNFNYELEILRHIAEDLEIESGEWNGEKHDPVPTGKEWVYLVQYTAGAEGWNCITCCTIIFYSQNYSYKATMQAAGRIDRVNTPYRTLYYYHLQSRSSIDLAIARALNNKKNFNERAFAM